jgi:hypothetical protein
LYRYGDYLNEDPSCIFSVAGAPSQGVLHACPNR